MKVKLGDIFEIGSGGTPSKTHPEYYDGDIPWVKTGDLKTMYLFDVEDAITEDGLKNSSAKMYEPDTVLIAMYGATIGATSILKISACTNQACAAFKPNDKVKPEYLYYFLRSKKDKFIKDGVGGAQPNISAGYLKKVCMELPELNEQKEIVDVLNNISGVIQMRKQELLKLDELIKARFIELFGDIHEPSKWEKKPWSELVTIQNGRDYKNILVESGGYPVYGTGGEMARASEYLCPENTIIVGRKGTINNPLLIKEKFWNVDTAFGVIVGNQLHYQYFYSFCRMFDFSTLNKQAVLPSTTKADLLKIEIAVPPMELQKQFAEFVKQVDKSKVAVQKALNEAQLLFDSLMQKYFG